MIFRRIFYMENVRKMRRNLFPRCAGLTIIELVLVILVIGILAAVVMPKMVSQTGITAFLAADLAASDIRSVQHAAMSSGSSKTIIFGGGGYTAEGLIPANRTLPGDAVADAYSITFNSFGEPDQGGGFDVSSGGNAIMITIEALTGKVTIN